MIINILFGFGSELKSYISYWTRFFIRANEYELGFKYQNYFSNYRIRVGSESRLDQLAALNPTLLENMTDNLRD